MAVKFDAFPAQVYIYICDYLEDGTPVLAVAATIEEIPEDSDGEKVGSYSLEEASTFKVRRVLTR